MNYKSYNDRTIRKIESVKEFMADRMFPEICTLDNIYAFETEEHLRKPPEYSEMNIIEPGTRWGKEYSSMWLRTKVRIPEGYDGMTIGIIPHTEACETMCFKNGIPAGIINSKNNFLGGVHSVMFLVTDAKAGEEYDVAFECYANHNILGCDPYITYGADEVEHSFTWTYSGVSLVYLNRDIYDFVFDTHIAIELSRLPENNFMSLKAQEALKEAYPYVIQDFLYATSEEINESCRKVSEILAPVFEKAGGDITRGYVGMTGHSHMDTAWLWPVSETIRKCARTYSQVLTYMDMYPDYTFIQSSALHLDWMREYYPDVFEGIKKRVAEGRYEPNGGVWVECDCNITSGESMIRQFLYGQRFTQKYLNYTSDSFWLPDTFGYNGNIPQIMKGCGVKYFFTTKISWNDLNKFPADSFVWRGIDGSEVLTHFTMIVVPPDVDGINYAIDSVADKKAAPMKYATYGFGDGGGGPTFGKLEFLKRTKDLPGLPVIEPCSASSFMHKLEKRIDKLPVYDGELYLELHRGTLTSIHDVKKNNRMAEIALRNLELFNVLTGNSINPKRDELYKILLKNQFHDILPGTCIPKVYDIAIPEMKQMISDTNNETEKYIKKLTEADENTVTVYNPLSFDRHDKVRFDGEVGFDGVIYQSFKDFDGNTKTDVSLSIPAMSSVILKREKIAPGQIRFEANGKHLTTPYYDVEFDENGYIKVLVDRKNGRHVEKGTTSLGTLWAGEDMPLSYDNWDIDDDAFDKLKPVTEHVSCEVVSCGSVEYRIRNTYRIAKKSEAVIDTVFYSNDRRIDFEVKLDCNDRHCLVKAGFDVDISSYTFKNEIQFGHMDRPTTRNNSWEAAKFEVCNHKWSDISENRYGVAVLNDCKYGISCEGSHIMLTLQKSGCRPDPYHNFGVHYMTYSLLPHEGSFSAESVVYPAYELNYAPITAEGIMNVPKLFDIDAPGVICETVKNAEDIENAYVLRLYECERNKTRCKVTLHDAKRAYITDMLENKNEELDIDENGNVELEFRPFEIKTLMIER